MAPVCMFSNDRMRYSLSPGQQTYSGKKLKFDFSKILLPFLSLFYIYICLFEAIWPFLNLCLGSVALHPY